MNTKKSIALIIVFSVISVLAIFGGALVSRSIAEHTLARKNIESMQAFWAAEAGINRALLELRANPAAPGPWTGLAGNNSYTATVTTISTTDRLVTSTGLAPAVNPQQTRVLQATISRYTPPDFYGNAIYSTGDVDANGSTYEVNGNVTYADNFTSAHPELIQPNPPVQDPSIKPLARLDFEQLFTVANAQGNVYDAARLSDVSKNKDAFPGSFWYNATEPNVVYIMGDLTISGNIGVIGGFFVVVGDVINTLDITQDTTINGNGMIDGLIYTRGEFRINGGGGNLNVNGGVWAGELARLNGNARIDYNATYMGAVMAMNVDSSFQVSTWRDTQIPYPVE